MIAFGPIPSRRLGLSLGINNILSQKICTYSCVYCQIGITKNRSMKRQSFYEPEVLVKEVVSHLAKLDRDHQPQYLTFVSNGEPTLDVHLGEEIRLLKELGIPVAVITNSTLISHEPVQDDLLEADWVSVKIDAVSEKVWREINQPDPGLEFEKIILGLQSFAGRYRGILNTETMLVEGVNDNKDQLDQTADFIAGLDPQRAYLSVPIRPPAVKTVKMISAQKIAQTWQIFQESGIQTELLTGFEGTDTGYTGNAFEDILNITAVHPLREDTLAELLKQDQADSSIVNSLISQGLIKSISHNGNMYYIRSYHY